MIYFLTPYHPDKSLGISYDWLIDTPPNIDDWVCMTDADTIFTTYDFGDQISATIEANPDYHLFTCMTNRVNNRIQVCGDWSSNDMAYHRMVGQQRWEEHGTTVLDITQDQLLSGMMLCTTHEHWMKSGMQGKRHKQGQMLGIDNEIHLAYRHAGLKVGLMQGIYLYHWYRGGDKSNKAHLI